MESSRIKRVGRIWQRIVTIEEAIEKLKHTSSSYDPADGSYEYDPERFDLTVCGTWSLNLEHAEVGHDVLEAIKRELMNIKERLLKEVDKLSRTNP